MSDKQKQMAIFLAGYIQGVWSKHREEPDPMVLAALKILEVPESMLFKHAEL